MAKRISDEVKIMESLRTLPDAKREVVLNLAMAEFRPKVKAKVPSPRKPAEKRISKEAAANQN